MRSDLAKNALLSIVSLVLFLALLEGICRLYPVRTDKVDVNHVNQVMMNVGDSTVMRFVEDPKLGYRLETRELDPNTFSDAWGRTHLRIKPDNVLRIVCVGGSTTFGTGASAGATFPALLEELFNRTFADCGKRVEVINAGMMGYNSWHTRIRAELELDSLKPDLYVVMDGLNDTISSMSSGPGFSGKLDLMTRQVNMNRGFWRETLVQASTLLSGSALYQRMRHTHEHLSARMKKDVEDPAVNVSTFGYRDNMERFVLGRREKGIQTVLLNYPWIVRQGGDFAKERARVVYPLNESYFRYFQAGREYIGKSNEALAKKLQVPLVDPQPMLDELTRDGENLYRYYSDSVHFTKYSNFFIALALFEGLRDVEPIKSALAECPRKELDPVVNSMWDAVFIHEHAMLGTGFPPDPPRGYSTRTVEMINVLDVATADPGARMFIVADASRPGIVVLEATQTGDPAESRTNGFNCMVFPRFNRPTDFIYIRAKGETLLAAKKPLASEDWSQIAERFGFHLPAGASRVEIVMGGNTQLWRRADTVLFYNPF